MENTEVIAMNRLELDGSEIRTEIWQTEDIAEISLLMPGCQAQELANLAAYLVSDFAAFVNGEVVTIDGGEWLYGAGEFNGLDHIEPEAWDSLEKAARGKN